MITRRQNDTNPAFYLLFTFIVIGQIDRTQFLIFDLRTPQTAAVVNLMAFQQGFRPLRSRAVSDSCLTVLSEEEDPLQLRTRPPEWFGIGAVSC